MRKPEMIIFDYGHTLISEPAFDGLRGMEAVLSLEGVSNPKGCTAQQAYELWDMQYGRARDARSCNLEIHNHAHMRFVFEYLGIENGLPGDEIDRVFWDTAAPGKPMPYAEEMLGYLNGTGIRSAVLSNICFSSALLAERINRLLPENRFEFFIATCEHMLRKPDPLIFELALRKAGLTADEVWYCGDTVRFDADGSRSAGLFPVWCDSELYRAYFPQDEGRPEYEHLHIRDMRGLIDTLETLA